MQSSPYWSNAKQLGPGRILLPHWKRSDTGQIWGFRAFLGQRMEGMAWKFACWFILTTYRTDEIMVTVCWFF